MMLTPLRLVAGDAQRGPGVVGSGNSSPSPLRISKLLEIFC